MEYIQDCGCRLCTYYGIEPDIIYCPKHKAADDLYEACKKMRDYLAISELSEEIKLVKQADKALAKAKVK